MKKVLALSMLVVLSTMSFAQINYNGSFGKGIRFETEDGSFGLKIGVRVQPRWDFVVLEQDGVDHFEQQAWVARGRLKFDGFMVNPDLRYKIEFDVVGGYVRDAMVKYRFSKHSDLWFGQGKLPGNRERVVSSGNLQFVNRSIFNNHYNIDRDVGIQFHHFFEIGEKFIIKDMWALSSGTGIRNKQFKPEPSLTGKIELLPMGKFKGLYVSGDLGREETLKMAIAFSADYNMGSYKTLSHIGSTVNANRDLLTLNADILLKLKGWSFMTEWGMRSLPNQSENAVIYDDAMQGTAAYYTGWGLNAQTGYLFKNNWEVSLRYAFTTPDDLVSTEGSTKNFYEQQIDHTIGVSKYIVGHKLKIQADVTYRDKAISPNETIGRLQMEIHF